MKSEIVFRISNMSCGACTASISEAVTKTAGVEKVSVSLITEEAKVVYDRLKMGSDDLKQVIEDCGFECETLKKVDSEAESERTISSTVAITGMTCGACSASVTEALEKVDGVKQVSVSLVTNEGLIKHRPSSGEIIQQTIEDCGFDAHIISKKVLDRSSGAKIISSRFSISGMTCGACSASITSSLEKLEGVVEVSVSLVTEEALVKHTEDVTTASIVEVVEDCGFDCGVINSSALTDDTMVDQDEEEQISLQIMGMNDNTDLSDLHYNIEAYLNSVAAVTDFNLSFTDRVAEATDDPHILEGGNSMAIQTLMSREQHDTRNSEENFIDECSITYKPSLIGLRDLIDGLNRIQEEIEFTIINSIDQSQTMQMKLLSRVRDIQFWRGNLLRSLLFGVPVILLDKLHNSTMDHILLFPGFFLITLLELILATIVQFNCGSVFNKKFLIFVKNRGRQANMDVLVCISSLISYYFSVALIVSNVWSGQRENPPQLLLDTTCMLIIFISFGKLLENKAKGATSTALSKLMSLTPTSCTIITDMEKYIRYLEAVETMGGEGGDDSTQNTFMDVSTRTMSIDLMQPADIAVVLPGEKLPADGVIVLGESEIDESIITGETLPVFKKKGDSVIGGSINGPNLLHIKVTKTGNNSQLKQIINLVKESQVNRAPVQRFADYLAARFVPAVLIVAALTFLFWILVCYVVHGLVSLPAIFQKDVNGKFFVCLRLGISVIVVACPCALGLAAPTAIMVGTGVGATHGILIKGGDVLEKASNVDIILFDKTGTLTTGEMTLKSSKQILSESLTLEDWWKLVGSLEANSEHPIGKAIVGAAKSRLKFKFEDDAFDTIIKDLTVFTGSGIKAFIQLPENDVGAFDIAIGNWRLIESEYQNLSTSVPKDATEILRKSVNSIAHVIINGEYGGYIELVDALKPKTRDVIDHLQIKKGFKVGIVTGDNRSVALNVGKELGVPESNIFSDVLPAHKDQIITDLKEKFGGDENVTIAFVGDGINDAPALAQADIGMAISSGTDIAIESADIVLVDKSKESDLFGVPAALDISKCTFTRIKRNFVWAGVYNMIMLPFAVGCFLPFNIMLPPAAAAGAMALSSVSVVLNSLLLKKWRPPNINSSDAYARADIEATIGDHFSLRDGTLDEFNQSKRHQRRTISKFFDKFKFATNRIDTLEYEMIPNNDR